MQYYSSYYVAISPKVLALLYRPGGVNSLMADASDAPSEVIQVLALRRLLEGLSWSLQ